jgi:ribosomal protein L37AE/L43A
MPYHTTLRCPSCDEYTLEADASGHWHCVQCGYHEDRGAAHQPTGPQVMTVRITVRKPETNFGFEKRGVDA